MECVTGFGINEIWRKHVGLYPFFRSFGHLLHFAVDIPNYGVTVIRRLQLTNFLGTYGTEKWAGQALAAATSTSTHFFSHLPGIPEIQRHTMAFVTGPLMIGGLIMTRRGSSVTM